MADTDNGGSQHLGSGTYPLTADQVTKVRKNHTQY